MNGGLGQPGWVRGPVRSDLAWPGMRSRYAWYPPTREPTTSGAHHVGVSFSSHRGQAREAGGRVVRDDIRAGTAFLTGPEPITWLGTTEPTEALEIYPDRGLLDQLGDLPAGDGVVDGVVFGIAAVLKKAHVTGVLPTDIEASTLAHRLVAHVQRLGTQPRAGSLCPVTLRRVVDFVESHLAGPLALEQLAAQAALSPFHFARAFRATTGLPPHRFVTALRLERARDHLVTSDRTVAEVAAMVGFSNVSHFRRLFRREFGFRPGQLRENRKIRPPGTTIAGGIVSA